MSREEGSLVGGVTAHSAVFPAGVGDAAARSVAYPVACGAHDDGGVGATPGPD